MYMSKKQHKQRQKRHIANSVKENHEVLILFYYQLVYANERKDWNTIKVLFTGHESTTFQNTIYEIANLQLKKSFSEVKLSVENKKKDWSAVESLIYALKQYVSIIPLDVVKSFLIHNGIRRITKGICMRRKSNVKMSIVTLQTETQNGIQRQKNGKSWNVSKNELLKPIQQFISPVNLNGYKFIKEEVERKIRLVERTAPSSHLVKERASF